MTPKIAQACLALVSAVSICLVGAAQDPHHEVPVSELLSKARIQVEKIKDDSERLMLLENIAVTDAWAGNIQLAQSEAERLGPLIEAPPHFGNCNSIYMAVLQAQAKAGDTDAAIMTIQKITSADKDEAYYSLAQELADQGKFDQAISEVEHTAARDNVRRRAQIFRELAITASNSRHTGDAATLFDKSESLSAQLQHDARVQTATIELPLSIAKSERLCGRSDNGAQLFSRTRTVIAGVSDESKQQQFLDMFAEAAAQAGDFDLSLRELHGTTDPMRRAQAVQGIVQGYLSDGVEDTTAALALASTISSVDDRVGMLASIASAQARRGDIAAAKRTVEECLKSLDQTSDSLRFWDTISLASTKYELGDRARAAELFDAAVKFAGRYKNHFESYEFYSLAVLVAERASLGDEQGALSTARGANDNALFGDIAEAEAEKGQADAALKWVEKLQDPFAKGNALMSLVRGILEKQDSDEEPKNAEYPRCK